MSAVLDDEAGVRAQFLLWGYAMTGDICETGALASERQHHDGRLRDKTAADLRGSLVGYPGQPYRRVRDHAALPWLTEHVLRGHEEWPGL